MKTKEQCFTCEGYGWFLVGSGEDGRSRAIERCDACQKFKGDLDAARAFFKSKIGRKFYLLQITITEHQLEPRA